MQVATVLILRNLTVCSKVYRAHGYRCLIRLMMIPANSPTNKARVMHLTLTLLAF